MQWAVGAPIVAMPQFYYESCPIALVLLGDDLGADLHGIANRIPDGRMFVHVIVQFFELILGSAGLDNGLDAQIAQPRSRVTDVHEALQASVTGDLER